MTQRYCPQCEGVLSVQSDRPVPPLILGFCPNCKWTGGPDDFLTEFKSTVNETKAHWSPYVSIDLETTGLNPDYCQILEFGAIIDDWHSPIEELPRFRRLIRLPKEKDGQFVVCGQPFAMALNADLLRKLADPRHSIGAVSCTEEGLGLAFADWLKEHNFDPMHVTAAGKNFANFDLQFLTLVPKFSEHVNFKHRSIDPAIFYWRPDVDDCIPDTKTCLERAGLNGRVAHTAVEDCVSVIQLIRRGVRKCQLSVSH